MTTKIQMRAGEVEFTLESDMPIAVSDIRDFLTQVQELAQSIAPPTATAPPPSSSIGNTANGQLLLEDGTPKLHVNSVAERLNASSGPEVAVASAAYLQIVQGKQSFTRKELLDSMKAATNVYNQNMSSNLSSIIKTLTGSKFNQLANDSYALKGDEIKDLRGKLAD
ncbi:MAG: hypothetical protein IE932_13480 [Sphingopyxis terrae]|nr:hypothetical protein [Sphingopyxis terrae]